MTRKYFGTDGIRGRANSFPMTAEMALKVAMAAASVLRSDSDDGDGHRKVLIGKDTRISGYMLEQAMCAGFVSMGVDVVLLGPIPTPAVAMLTKTQRADAGVMISASHNPYEDNGIKLFGGDGFKLSDEIEHAIEAKLDADMAGELVSPDALGKAVRLDDARGRYAEDIKQSFPDGLTLKGMKIVLDCAHGAAYKVAPQVLEELGANVVLIGAKPDGYNINDNVGATATKALQETVIEENADIGVALDGDADRLIMVDEKGDVIDGDQLMGVLAMTEKSANRLVKDTLVSTVMSNLGLERFLDAQGITMLRAAVGDRYVVKEMREHGYNLGGEQSGHIVMSDHSTTGDGTLAALHILAILKQSDKPASEALRVFTPLPQLLRNVRFSGGKPMDDAGVQAAITQAEETLANDGRLLVRASGTEPVIRVMAEGDDAKMVEDVVGKLCDVIAKVAG